MRALREHLLGLAVSVDERLGTLFLGAAGQKILMHFVVHLSVPDVSIPELVRVVGCGEGSACFSTQSKPMAISMSSMNVRARTRAVMS